MNYERVYERFVADRRSKEAGRIASGDYLERHHIRPRAQGGSNAPGNIISLSPEDHFFAHLLLAKAFGGKFWWPLMMMAGSSPSRKGVDATIAARMRKHYAAARRAMGRDGNVLFNAAIHEWKNLDTGAIASLCLYDMHKAHGGGRGSWTAVVSGQRKTYRGWTMADREVRIRGNKGKIFAFVNRDGRTFRGTQGEFCAMASASVAAGSRVVRHRSVTRCGWRLDGVADRPHNTRRDGTGSGSVGAIIALVRHDGQTLVGNRVEIARQLGTTPASVSASLYCLRKGKVKSFKGYRFAA